MRPPLLAFFVLLLTMICGPASAQSFGEFKSLDEHLDLEDPRTITDVTSIYDLGEFFPDSSHGLLIFRLPRRTIGLYKFADGRLMHIHRAEPWAYVAGAAPLLIDGQRKVAVAYEYRRPDPEKTQGKLWRQKIKVVVYDSQLDNPEVAFEEFTPERGEVTLFTEQSGRLFINFFHSEQFTKGGFLQKNPANSWAFKRQIAGYQQMHVDLDGENFVVGSPFSDWEDKGAGELRLWTNGQWTELPSIRGVSAVSFIRPQSDALPQILVADGLPNSREKRGKPQLGLISRDFKTGQYLRQTVATMPGMSRAVQKIVPLTINGKPGILIKDPWFISLYHPQENWRREVVYRKNSRKPGEQMDFVCLSSAGAEIVLSLLEGELLYLLKYDTSSAKQGKTQSRKKSNTKPRLNRNNLDH